jgi:hypothetical protein
MKALRYMLYVSCLVMLGGIFESPALADDLEGVEYASVAPMLDFSKISSKENDRLKEIAKTSKDAKFVPCATEEDCLRDLQDAQTAQDDSDKFQLVAEFVTKPQHGMFIYKQALSKK